MKTLYRGILGSILLIFVQGIYATKVPPGKIVPQSNKVIVERMMLGFNNKYLYGFDYRKKIVFPTDVRRDNLQYHMIIPGSDEALIIIFHNSEPEVKLISYPGYATELAKKVSRAVLLGNKTNAKIKPAGNFYIDYIGTSSQYNELRNKDILMHYGNSVGADLTRIFGAVTKYFSGTREKEYMGILAVMLENSADLAAYRQMVWENYDRNLGKTLDRSINNSLPGVKSNIDIPFDDVLAKNVELYVKGRVSADKFKGFINNTIKERLQKQKKYGEVQSYEVQSVKYQIQFVLDEINHWRELMNRYGGGKFWEGNQKILSFQQIANEVSGLSAEATLNKIKKLPVDPAPFIAALPKPLPQQNVTVEKVTARVDLQSKDQGTVTGNIVTAKVSEKTAQEANVRGKKENNAGVTVVETKGDIQHVSKEEPVTTEPNTNNMTVPVPENEKEMSFAGDINKMLYMAVKEGSDDEIIQLIGQGADIERKMVDGKSVFQVLAERTKNKKVIDALINRGLAINRQDDYGNTPLQYAIMVGNDVFAQTLIDRGARNDLLNKQGFAPLHLSVLTGNVDITKALLSKGINIDIRGNAGYTPLHISTELGNYNCTKLLLTSGANKKLKTMQHLSSVKISKIQKVKDVQKLLKTNGNYTSAFAGNITPPSVVVRDPNKYPAVSITLPYDDFLLSKKRTWNTMRWISLPLMIASGVATGYLHMKANDYYEEYQKATEEEEARYNYDQTGKYDTYSYVAGGVSVASMGVFVYSSIKLSSVKKQLRKVFSK
jgi:hypothetical protein